MKALLLAPDPAAALAAVRGRPPALAHVRALVRAGVTGIVVSTPAASALAALLGDGAAHGARIAYAQPGAGAGGSIARALPLLGDEAFLLVDAAVHAPGADFADLAGALPERDATGRPWADDARDVAWLSLVEAQPGAPALFSMTLYALSLAAPARYGYAGIAVLRPGPFAGAADGAGLLDVLRPHVLRGRVGGDLLPGAWSYGPPASQGTPQ